MQRNCIKSPNKSALADKLDKEHWYQIAISIGGQNNNGRSDYIFTYF